MTARYQDTPMIEDGSTTEAYTEDDRVHMICCIERGRRAGSCFRPRLSTKKQTDRTSRRLNAERSPALTTI